jgi:taurine dioxygenase
MSDNLTVHPLSSAIGAEIRGVDIANEIQEAAMQQIIATWHEHLVLLFRDQTITAEQQVGFAHRFGPVEPRHRPKDQRADDGIAGHPDAMLISNIRENGKPIGSLPDGEMEFHCDTCYREIPSRGAFLYAMEVPQQGGDTMFLNLYRAYETLPDDLKRRIAGRKALNVYSYGAMSRDGNAPDLTNAPHFAHPVVRTHPETGRKALYVNRLMTWRIEGMEADESRALLDALFDHIEQPQFIYTHHWRPGDLLLWDNRCTLHARTDFSADERRLLRRVVLSGDRPYEVAA